MRLLTAAIAVPPLLLLLFKGPSWGFFLLVALVAALAGVELFRMTHPGDGVAQAIGVLSSLVVAVSLYAFGDDSRVLMSVLLIVPIVGMLVPLLRLGDMATAGLRMMASVAGPLVLGAPPAAAAVLGRAACACWPVWLGLCTWGRRWRRWRCCDATAGPTAQGGCF